MNNLSWLLYWADVVDSLNEVLGLLIFFGVVGIAASTIGGFVIAANNYSKDEEDAAISARLFRIAKRLGFLVPVLMVLIALTPAKETIYAIAASELGETALRSPTGSKAVAALNAWLDDQIESDDKDEDTDTDTDTE